MEETQNIYGNRDDLRLLGTKEEALKDADALVIITEWTNFRAPDFELINQLLREPLIFDGRNLFNPSRLSEKGFTYYSMGRK
ncbi:UDP-glucose 6-dehydrogenase YwqF [compost metagenome]